VLPSSIITVLKSFDDGPPNTSPIPILAELALYIILPFPALRFDFGYGW
jgi:hypothetical protein